MRRGVCIGLFDPEKIVLIYKMNFRRRRQEVRGKIEDFKWLIPQPKPEGCQLQRGEGCVQNIASHAVYYTHLSYADPKPPYVLLAPPVKPVTVETNREVIVRKSIVGTVTDCVIYRSSDKGQGNHSCLTQRVRGPGPSQAVMRTEWQSEVQNRTEMALRSALGRKEKIASTSRCIAVGFLTVWFNTVEAWSQIPASLMQKIPPFQARLVVVCRLVSAFSVTQFHLFCPTPCILHSRPEKIVLILKNKSIPADKMQTNECYRMPETRPGPLHPPPAMWPSTSHWSPWALFPH